VARHCQRIKSRRRLPAAGSIPFGSPSTPAVGRGRTCVNGTGGDADCTGVASCVLAAPPSVQISPPALATAVCPA
jgi:hypothetical protein